MKKSPSKQIQEKYIPLLSGLFTNIENYIGKEVIVGIRPHDISEYRSLTKKVERHCLKAEVDIVEPLGSESIVRFITGKDRLTSSFSDNSRVKSRDIIGAFIDIPMVHLFDKSSEVTLKEIDLVYLKKRYLSNNKASIFIFKEFDLLCKHTGDL